MPDSTSPVTGRARSAAIQTWSAGGERVDYSRATSAQTANDSLLAIYTSILTDRLWPLWKSFHNGQERPADRRSAWPTFALGGVLIALATSETMSFVMLWMKVGFNPGFDVHWGGAWAPGCAVGLTTGAVVVLLVQRLVARWIDETRSRCRESDRAGREKQREQAQRFARGERSAGHGARSPSCAAVAKPANGSSR